MMRFLLWLLLSGFGVVCLGQVDYTSDSPYRWHPEGGEVWTLGPQTRVYVGPDTQATLHATLPTGTALQLLERLDETETRQGFRANWYRVQYQKEDVFIWGGDIALTKAESRATPLTMTYGLQKIRKVQRGNYQEPQLDIVFVASYQGQFIDSLHIAAIGTLYTKTQVQLKGAQGLAGIKEVVEIAFSDGYCGGVAATTTLLWDGKNWKELGLLSQGFGDNHFSNAYYKYPQEHQQGSHIIELHQEEGYYNQEKQPIYTLQETKIYEWTGAQLLLIEGGLED
ncbi:MAG: hypothetical protein ACRBFS_18655 [Aureispira sp.]